MKSFIFPLAVLAIILASCGRQSSDYKSLRDQNDSLLRAKHQLQDEVDSYFSTLNQIEQNIEKIKDAENTITVNPSDKELDQDVRDKINEDITYLNDMLQTNKEELARLRAKLKRSSFKSNELEQAIVRLNKLLEEESAKVANLTSQLAQKDSVITQLGNKVNDLGRNVEELSNDNKSKESRISEQETTIHTAWYVLGTRKELKEQRIITSDGLFSSQKVLQGDFNKNYFVRIDARNTKSIPLYSTRAKILTSHPKSSYTLEKENGNYTLLIVDPNEFWSISKYLVIEVD